MAGTLRDDLASLRIERRGSIPPRKSGRPGPGGIGVLSALLWLIPVALLAGAGSVAYLQYEKIRPRAEVHVGQVQEMTTGEAETLLSAKGYIKSEYQAMIGSKMPGRIREIGPDLLSGLDPPPPLKEGSKVRKGQILAVLEHDELIAQRDQRKAMLRRTEADLHKAEADLKVAQAELQFAQADFEMKDRKANRRTQLGTRGTVTGEELEQYVFDRRMAQSKIESLRAAIAAQEAAIASQKAMMTAQRAMIAETESQIEDMKVKAPHDGTITEKGADVGETILLGGMGAASGRGSVATIADLTDLEVETDIAENLLGRVEKGQPAEISVSAVPDRRYRGHLSRFIPMGDRTRGTVKVRVQIEDADERLFPELVATVHFLPKRDGSETQSGKTFLFVPRSALVEQAGHQHVWTLDGKGRLQRRLVEVVVTKDDLARVEKGLQAGDKVVLNPPDSLKNGQAVNIAD